METVRESRFETKRGTLVWTEMPDRIRVEDQPPMSWPRRCLAVLIPLAGFVLWGWGLLTVGHMLRWW